MMRSLLLALALVAGSAFAQDVRLYGQDETVDPQDVARILDRSQPIKWRSMRLLDGSPSAQQAAKAEKSALALPVQFAFDSTEILPAAKPQLDALAEGIRLLPGTQSVVIEGHTDAVGGEAYNDRLSVARAEAVKRYLVAMHGIDAARLQTVGLGKNAPLPGSDPLAPENRRVQFRGE